MITRKWSFVFILSLLLGVLPAAADEDIATLIRTKAEQGDAEAQLWLGAQYEYGLGLKENYQESLKWWLKAAEQGNIDAQYKLGYRYAFGPFSANEEPDYQDGIKWLSKAAEQGHDEAQYWLGTIYATGYGVNKDQEEASSWYHRAAEQGHPGAKDALTKIRAAK